MAYYSSNDFLAAEPVVSVEFIVGARGLAPELGASASTGRRRNDDDSNDDAHDVPMDFATKIPLWWLEGALWEDVDLVGVPDAFDDDVFASLEAPNGGRMTDLRSRCENYFGFGRRLVAALRRQEAAAENGDVERVERLGEKIERAFARRWSECLCEVLGRCDDADAIERSLTREERKIWNAGREAQKAYERWRYGRGERLVASKIVQDAKRRKREANNAM